MAIGLLLAALAVAVAGCGSGETARISGAWMSADEEGQQPVTTYAKQAAFYAQVDVRGAPDDMKLAATWVAVDAEGTEPGTVLDEIEVDAGTGRARFMLANEGLWAPGIYKIDIYLDGRLDRTLEFFVE